jgi:hypothetical protein
MDREYHGVAVSKRHDGARLHALTLLGQHELASGEILSRLLTLSGVSS